MLVDEERLAGFFLGFLPDDHAVLCRPEPLLAFPAGQVFAIEHFHKAVSARFWQLELGCLGFDRGLLLPADQQGGRAQADERDEAEALEVREKKASLDLRW